MGRAHEVRAKKMAQTNAAKSALYNRASKEIYLAAKGGIPDPDSNLSLRAAIEKFKGQGVTRDVIDRAIQKAKGSDAATYLSGRYEGYGPGGVAIIVDTLSDNDKRAFANVRAVFTHKGGKIGNTGSVTYLFQNLGDFVFEATGDDVEKITDALILGDVDVKNVEYSDEDGTIEVTVDYKDFNKAHDILKDQGIEEFLKSEIGMVAPDRKHVEGEERTKLINFVNALNAIEDVQNVYTDADFDVNNAEVEDESK